MAAPLAIITAQPQFSAISPKRLSTQDSRFSSPDLLAVIFSRRLISYLRVVDFESSSCGKPAAPGHESGGTFAKAFAFGRVPERSNHYERGHRVAD